MLNNDKIDKSLIFTNLPKISGKRNFLNHSVTLFMFIIYHSINMQISKSKFNLGTI